MGFILVASLVIGAASGIAQHKAAKDSARAQKEANRISTAEWQVQDRAARARAAREKRLRRARIANQSKQAGSGGSSGEAGGLAALGSNFDRIIANQRGTEFTRGKLSAANQKATDAEARFNTSKAIGDFGQKALGAYKDYKS